MKIAIAGCGWLGEALAENLSFKGNEVTGTKRSETSGSQLFRLVKFSPSEAVSKEVKTFFEAAEWLVLSFPPDRSSYETYAENCLATALLSGKNTNLLMISSTGVYAEKPGIAIEEDADHSRPNPVLNAEKKLLELYGERLTIIRMAGLFGEDRIIVNHMSASGKTYNGNEPVNLIHKEDAAGICAFVIENGITGKIINACAPDHPLKKDFYTALAVKAGISPPLFESGKNGKIVSSEKSTALGYKYRFELLSSFM